MGPLHLGSHCGCEVEMILVLGGYAEVLTRKSADGWGEVVVDVL